MDFVIDCSATMPWLLANDDSGYADKTLMRLSTSSAVVPAIWSLEVANVLLVFARKKRVSSKNALAFMHALQQLPISEEATPQLRVFGRIHELAAKFSLSAYDATYLELSLRHDIPLATLDKRLRKAAIASKVGIVAL